MQRSVFCAILLIVMVGLPGLARRYAEVTNENRWTVVGRWKVKFDVSGTGERNLIFDARPGGAGSFLLLDTEPDNKPAVTPVASAWLTTVDDRVSFSGEVELPVGTCCREVGTLAFKGKPAPNGSIIGKVVFIGTTIDEENFNGFRSSVGTFSASRVQK